VLTRRFPDASRLMAVCDNSFSAAESIIERARLDGSLRSDFTASDLLFFFASHAPLARAAASDGSQAWRRPVGFMLDGLRAAAAKPVSVEPMPVEQINRLLMP
jgi:hypothetical protein